MNLTSVLAACLLSGLLVCSNFQDTEAIGKIKKLLPLLLLGGAGKRVVPLPIPFPIPIALSSSHTYGSYDGWNSYGSYGGYGHGLDYGQSVGFEHSVGFDSPLLGGYSYGGFSGSRW
ncbi:uncharacterized protein LOC143231418 [Tachypleus tridentatus]|uniref:uncharacterized protein LOC143231418 n=1 Tax=Tachypleus tridentatus TaxID=6853 RepID=UPI003FD36AD8